MLNSLKGMDNPKMKIRSTPMLFQTCMSDNVRISITSVVIFLCVVCSHTVASAKQKTKQETVLVEVTKDEVHAKVFSVYSHVN